MSQINKKFLEANSVDGTKIRLSNNEALRARNVANSADVDMLKLSTSNQVQVLTTVVPDTSNTRDLGTDVNRFATIYGKDIQACLFSGTGRLLTADGSLTNQMELFSVSGSTPSGATVNSHIRTMIASNNLGLYSIGDSNVDSNPTGSLLIETGNKSAGSGNSGSISILVGSSSGGNGGNIILEAGTGGSSDGEIRLNSLVRINSSYITIGTEASALDCDISTALDGSVAGYTGAIQIASGGATFGSGLSGSGNVTVNTGGVSETSANSGSTTIRTGNSSGTGGDTGSVTLLTGDADEVSGDIVIQTGTAGTTRGSISLDATEVNVNSVKIINLATPTAGTDAANKSYVDSAAIYVTGDLGQVSFSLANNQSSYSNVTGVAFANGTSRSAEIHYSVYVNATSSLYESGKLRLIQKGSSWSIARSMVGDDALVDFDVTTSGQLQYKTANYSGFSAATLKCRAITTSV